MKTLLRSLLCLSALGLTCLRALAGGTLTPVGSGLSPLQIRDHSAHVTLNNGFARVEVTQTFFNPNAQAIEAVYSFPVPQGASLTEVNLTAGDLHLQGEVRPLGEAQQTYEEQRAAGRTAGFAKRNGYQNFEYRVSSIPAQGEALMQFVYLQPLQIDTGVGRFVYPLEEGATDQKAQGFWTQNSSVEGTFRFQVELKSAVPVADVRLPGREGSATIEKRADGHYVAGFSQTGARLDRDVVFYYRLADNLPGRVEVIPYRAAANQPGTFMMVVTPGQDLQPIKRGADYVYVLDVSGSMQTKLPRLVDGVSQALGQMKPEDRFRVVTFNDRANELVGWTQATPENVQRALATVGAVRAQGSTNLFDGLRKSLQHLDSERATSLVLVTDGVANEGVVDPRSFRQLFDRTDLRVFGFLMGNSSNWPLLRTIAEASGGYYTAVSNDDDIVGQILMAKAKIGVEALHDFRYSFQGVRVSDTTGNLPRKIFCGQQLVVFGRYDTAGEAELVLEAKMTGLDKTYRTRFTFPEIATENPEIERLWALARIEEWEQLSNVGLMPEKEAKAQIQELAMTYQIVTDETAMVVLEESAFAQKGWERLNLARTQLERAAQAQRAQQPATSHRVDTQQPAFNAPAPHVSRFGSGGGALEMDVVGVGLIFLIVAGVAISHAQRSRDEGKRKDK